MKRKRPRNAPQSDLNAIIGAETLCNGGNKYIKGKRVVIVAVWKGALKPDFDVDADDAYIRDDETLKRVGGVDAFDEVEVETCERWQRSVSQGTVKATDLEMFAKPKRRDLFEFAATKKSGNAKE